MSHDERTCPEASKHLACTDPFKLVGSVCTPSLREVVLIYGVWSFFFGDSLAFSVPFREQPGQPHHGRAHPGPLLTPVGVGILQAHFNLY